MPIYRLNLDRATLLQLGAGTTIILFVAFFSGTLLGYSLSTGTPVAEDAGSDAVQLAQAVGPAPACAPEERMALDLDAILPTLNLPARAAWAPPAPAIDLEDRSVDIQLPEPSPAAPEVVRQAEVLPEPPTTSGGFAVQVGAFGVRANADALAADLRARGYEPLIIAAQTRSGDWLEHVHLSIHADETAARAVAEAFVRSEQLTAVVVPAPRREGRR